MPPALVPGPPAAVCQAGYNYAARSSLGTLLNPFGASITEQAEPTILGARDHTTAYVNLGYRNPDTRTIPYWVQGGIVRGSVGGVADVGHPMVYVEAQTPAGYTYRTLGEASVGSTHSFRLTATGTTGTLVAITIDGVSQGTFDLGTVANDASVAAESYTESGGACPHYDWRWSRFAPSVPTTTLGRLPSTATDDSVAAQL